MIINEYPSSHTTIRAKVSTLKRIKAIMNDKESIDDTLNRILDFYTLPNPITNIIQPPDYGDGVRIIQPPDFDMDEYLKDMRKIIELDYKGNEVLISKSINILKEKKMNELKVKIEDLCKN